MRRLIYVVVALAFVASSTFLAASASAQEGTPEPAGGMLAELGLSEVNIVATESGFELPEEVTAGTVLLTLENTAPFPMGFSLIQLPEGVSLDDLMPPPAEDGAATPEEGIEATPVGEEALALPDELYEATWAGGVFAFPGETAQAVVTLMEGEWILEVPPDSGLEPQVFTVTGEAEAVDVTVESLQVELDDYQVALPEVIAAGPQVLEVTNVGTEPHEMFIVSTGERLTPEDAEMLIALPEGEEPPEGLPNPEEFMPVGFVSPISQDQTILVELALEPGHYAAVCFIPDREGNEPHAELGMVSVFSIGAEGEEVEPPASPEPADHGH